MRLLLLAPLILAGCAQLAAPFLPAYRDEAVPIASKADLDLARFAGRWIEVARFPVPFQSACAGAVAQYGPAGPDALSVRNLCLDASGTAIREIAGRAEVIGPGRLAVRLRGVPGAAPLWVLWVDEGYRTAVLGQPDGRAGWILDRKGGADAARIAAALEVLRFNGYDTDRIVFSTASPPSFR
jgi:apolipoprotein D and lipocalin family protein